MNEQIIKTQKLSFSQYVNSGKGQTLIGNAIKSPAKRDAFVTAIVSAVATNPELQECTPASIISAALQGVALGLAPSPQLGQFYMVPFKNQLKDRDGNKLWATDERGNKIKDRNGKWIPITESVATFVPGYRGYIQLAMRSGQYVDLDAVPVREGEFLGYDSFTRRPRFSWLESEEERQTRPVVGYMAYFELVNGARKVIYWPKEQMVSHADRYSPAFSRDAKVDRSGRVTKVSFADYEAGNFPPEDAWKYSSFWYKDFDVMACKTILRQLITKWGPVSIESVNVQAAIEQDEKVDAYGENASMLDSDGFLPAARPDATPDNDSEQEQQGEQKTQDEPAETGGAKPMGLDAL